jgi:hypothetical protein
MLSVIYDKCQLCCVANKPIRLSVVMLNFVMLSGGAPINCALNGEKSCIALGISMVPDTQHNNTQQYEIIIKTLSTMSFSMMTLSITTLSITTLTIATFTKTTLSITTFSTMTFSTLSIMVKSCYAECHLY